MTAAVPAALLLDGVLDAAQAADTVRSILAHQQPDGALPWFHGGHLDPWDHTEAAMALDTAGEHAAAEAAYQWLADRQNPDGSWYAAYAYGQPGVPDGTATDLARETNFCAYVAVGAWHHHLSTGDDRFLERIWPTVSRALDHTVRLSLPGGAIAWRQDEDGTAATEALLTGSCSILHALRCGLAVADHLDRPQPDWELAAGRLRHAIARHPERFLDKNRYSMDWYYPVLGTALRGEDATRRLAADWDRFVVPGLGVRCVSDRPWVTGGESAELALALWAAGQSDQAVDILRWIQHLRHEDGSYWTGYVYEDRAIWPEERTTWTAGALLLAVAALGGDDATVSVFGGERLPAGLAVNDCC
ncbi:prenyltransferase/squalene oxidase-like repeat protein [Kitasatospora sp. SolWspMP-SS2h]|uniref:prenyltransferase/squalene oxidase repeat-containing protein n=1 Tax=Kitasatospora sp. SolWspMP-SS2h TaxID=1305729 RepID=UPI000DBF8440|nr:prenyltransferase/squalene oxidase repeat-containing protein [Kitasatospora sp. SolWspMP-SS2h]RAJ42755.1 prenyltransferase/squalene oxidase-like repeat protein [Kitasatospora sp. SolWspMP-SS2h]